MKKLMCVALVAFLSGCLMTRNELKEQEQKQVLQEQVTTLQQTHAQEQVRQEEYDDQIRNLNNRIDQLDHQLSQIQGAQKTQQDSQAHVHDEVGAKFKALEEGLLKLETQTNANSQDIEELKKPKTPPKAEAAGNE